MSGVYPSTDALPSQQYLENLKNPLPVELWLQNLQGPDGEWTLKGARLGGCSLEWFWTIVVLLTSAALFYWLAHRLGGYVDINLFSLQGLYVNRLVRCYLGASRRKSRTAPDRVLGAPMNTSGGVRDPQPLTGFDPGDDFPLARLRYDAADATIDERPYRGPFPLINVALNLVEGEELAWQERKAESFVLTPRYCGSKTTGFRTTEWYASGLTLGTALGISGAAVSPNMGFHSSRAITALVDPVQPNAPRCLAGQPAALRLEGPGTRVWPVIPHQGSLRPHQRRGPLRLLVGRRPFRQPGRLRVDPPPVPVYRGE